MVLAYGPPECSQKAALKVWLGEISPQGTCPVFLLKNCQMTLLLGKETVPKILSKQPVNRTAVFEHFWDEIYTQWPQQGHIPKDVSLRCHSRHF